MKILCLCASQNPNSKSSRLLQIAFDHLNENRTEVEHIKIADYELPMAGAEGSFSHPQVEHIRTSIEEATGVIIASPIYNYDLNSSAKNLMELTGKAWRKTVVGCICAAGGESSMMAPLGFLNSLMIDFRCTLVPRYLVASPKSWELSGEPTAETIERVKNLAESVKNYAIALQNVIV